MKAFSGEVRIRRVQVLGGMAFEVTAFPSKEKVCFGRIDDTFVTLARLFADVPVPVPSKTELGTLNKKSPSVESRLMKILATRKTATMTEIKSYPVMRDVPIGTISSCLSTLHKKGTLIHDNSRPFRYSIKNSPKNP